MRSMVEGGPSPPQRLLPGPLHPALTGAVPLPVPGRSKGPAPPPYILYVTRA